MSLWRFYARRLANILVAAAAMAILLSGLAMFIKLGNDEQRLAEQQAQLSGRVRSTGDLITFEGETLRQIEARQRAEANAMLHLIYGALNQQRARDGLPPLVVPEFD